MKKHALLLLILALISGCATYIPFGWVYTNGKTGVSENNTVEGTKTGRACMNSYLGLVAVGDASVDTAKANANITKVATIDYEVNNVLGFVGEYCTVVKGS